MVYSVAWNEASPVGATTPAADIDTEFQNFKISIRERMNDLVGAGNWEDDGVEPKTLAGAPTMVRAFSFLSDPITETKLLGWIIEEDPDSIYNVGTNDFEIQTSGVYLLALNISSNVPDGSSIIQWSVRKNTSNVLGGSSIRGIQAAPVGNTKNLSGCTVVVATLTDTDTIQVFGRIDQIPSNFTAQLSISKMN